MYRVLDTHKDAAIMIRTKMNEYKYFQEYRSIVDIAQDIHVGEAYLV